MSALIVMYHGVERRAGPLFVEPSLFAEHLDTVLASGATVLTVGEIADLLRAGRLPAKAVALTFDDGFRSVAESAAPALAERNLRATVFCVAGRLGGTNAWPTARADAPAVELATVAQLTALAGSGFEIGGHGMEHAPLDTDDDATIRREVHDGKAALEQAVGSQVRSFAYPYGARPSAAARRAVSASYGAACTTRIGRVEPQSDPQSLARVDAHYLRSPERLAAVLAGGSNRYLALRRTAAGARRRVRHDYAGPPA